MDDDFVLTLSVHKRGPHAIRLNTPMKKADIIVCSPQGIFNEIKKDADVQNFLSSFHTVMIDSIDYINDT